MKICKDCKFLIGKHVFKNEGFCNMYNIFIKKTENVCIYFKPKEKDKI